MRRDHPGLSQRIVLSLGASVIIALASLGALLVQRPDFWSVALLSAIIGGFGAYQIKARALFKGYNYPFLGLFLALQAATQPTLQPTVLALVALGAMVLIMLLFQHPEQTPLIFLIMMVCGLGALGSRCFLLLAPALMIALAFVGAMSMRGFVASVLGLLTPPLILIGFGLYNPENLLIIYGQQWFVGINFAVVIAAAPAIIFALTTFLTAYGYPQKQRARNMAIISLTASSFLMSVADSVNATDYVGLINLCSAYWVAHYAATRRQGWVAVVLTLSFAIYYAFSY